jgi:hypothetical protein
VTQAANEKTLCFCSLVILVLKVTGRLLVINGQTETIKMIVKVCLGYDTRAEIAWRNL